MGSIKRDCGNCPNHDPQHRLRSAYSGWEVHPSWKMAMDSLDTYSHWVSEVVVPIAFQWIEEHKADVYANIPPELKEDVGVVVSAAFGLVSQMPYYKKGLEVSKQIRQEQNDGILDTSKFNPVWTAIATKVRQEVDAAFARYKNVLPHYGDE